MGWQDDPVAQPAQAAGPAWAQDEVVAPAAATPRPGDPGFQEYVQRKWGAIDPSEYDPASPEFQAKYGATSGATGFQNFMAGAGKSVVDLGRGVRQIGAEVADFVSPRQRSVRDLISGDDPSRAGALRAEQDEVNRLDAPLMDSGAGTSGYIGGSLATTLLPASLIGRGAQALNLGRTAGAARAFVNPNTYKAAAASGAVQGALRPVGEGESRTLNTALGAGLGAGAQGTANLIGRVAQPLTQKLSAAHKEAIEILKRAGVPLDAAQRSGSKGAELVKRAVSDNPLTAPGQAAFVEKQNKAFTKAVLNTIGENADEATADVMGAASARIGQVFEDVADRTPVKYDKALHEKVAEISQQAFRELEGPQYGVIANQIDEIFKKAEQGEGEIIGKGYQNIKTALDRIQKDGGSKGHWAGELKEAIEDALQRSAKPEDLKALKLARAQWRRMRQIEGAIDAEGAGRISANKLANILAQKSNRSQALYGRGDQELVKLAQAGKQIIPDKFPNSGTPARLAAQLVAPAALGLGAGAATGDTGTGLATAAGSAALLFGGRAGLNNPLLSAYLGDGIVPGLLRNTLMAPQRAGLLGRQVPIVSIPALQE